MKRNLKEETFNPHCKENRITIPDIPEDCSELILSFIPLGYFPFIRTTSKNFLWMTNKICEQIFSKTDKYKDPKQNDDTIKLPNENPVEIREFKKLEKDFFVPYGNAVRAGFFGESGNSYDENNLIEHPTYCLPKPTLIRYRKWAQYTVGSFYELFCINDIVIDGNLEFFQKYFKIQYFEPYYKTFRIAMKYGHNNFTTWLLKIGYQCRGLKDRYTIMKYGSFSMNLYAHKTMELEKADLSPCLQEKRFKLFFCLFILEIPQLDDIGAKFKNRHSFYKYKKCYPLLAKEGQYHLFTQLGITHDTAASNLLTCPIFFNSLQCALKNNQLDFILKTLKLDNSGAFKNNIAAYEEDNQASSLIKMVPEVLMPQILFLDNVKEEILKTALHKICELRTKKISLTADVISNLVFHKGPGILENLEPYVHYAPKMVGIYSFFKIHNYPCQSPHGNLNCVKYLYNKFGNKPHRNQFALAFFTADQDFFDWLNNNFDIISVYLDYSESREPEDVNVVTVPHLKILAHDIIYMGTNYPTHPKCVEEDKVRSSFLEYVFDKIRKRVPSFSICHSEYLKLLPYLDNMPLFSEKISCYTTKKE